MNDKTKSKVDTRIETEELKDEELRDEELENVDGGPLYPLPPMKGIDGESMDRLDKTTEYDVTTDYKR